MANYLRKRLIFWSVVSGPFIWWAFVLLIPYLIMFALSFYTRKFPFHVPDLQLGNYLTLITDPQYYTVFVRTIRVAFSVSIVSLLLSFPLAYFLARKIKSVRLQLLLYVATIIPLWVSYLLRAYTWKTILGSEGVLNSFFIWAGFI